MADITGPLLMYNTTRCESCRDGYSDGLGAYSGCDDIRRTSRCVALHSARSGVAESTGVCMGNVGNVAARKGPLEVNNNMDLDGSRRDKRISSWQLDSSATWRDNDLDTWQLHRCFISGDDRIVHDSQHTRGRVPVGGENCAINNRGRLKVEQGDLNTGTRRNVASSQHDNSELLKKKQFERDLDILFSPEPDKLSDTYSLTYSEESISLDTSHDGEFARDEEWSEFGGSPRETINNDDKQSDGTHTCGGGTGVREPAAEYKAVDSWECLEEWNMRPSRQECKWTEPVVTKSGGDHALDVTNNIVSEDHWNVVNDPGNKKSTFKFPVSKTEQFHTEVKRTSGVVDATQYLSGANQDADWGKKERILKGGNWGKDNTLKTESLGIDKTLKGGYRGKDATLKGGNQEKKTALKVESLGTDKIVKSDNCKPVMMPACSLLTRKFGTVHSSCDECSNLEVEATCDEVFDDDEYYLGPPSEPNGNGVIDGQGLVTLRMIPDEQGRFGFNVKGGADQGMPIIVSRVAPNTPADNAMPRLNEGDQVLFINGRDVSQHTHEQVVMFIRASRESHTGELILKVRPNAYSGEDNLEEPDFVYDPDTHQISSSAGGANTLDISLKLLEESLNSGAALAQFEQLYRKKPGMTMNAARLENNIPKNRYRDISPYDQTRVILKTGASGDYINANYVNMEIPVSGIVNRYIAAQGPLPATCTDFWEMIWEQQSTLVVMLTTKVERGRIKCHQYWPDLYETSDYGTLQITCVKEEESSSFAFREFNLTHVETQEERHISHMQYIAWPDHGVPDDPADFLEFVVKVRQKRIGIVEPSIVHCSAGIGRTGVLITMETAMCLVEGNQPVYPLSIVRQMRDQRAMLIQTPSQYKFVCEAIIRSYNEGIVKASSDYQR